ncbi:MAG: DegT/DnrJ/EryC1/StrS family aminotransferase [Flavobacterium sp.]|jgi:dTDP-4-amino-4,6-dideoxygalactose transaminase
MIKFLDLKKTNQPFESAFKQKMEQFLEGGWYILGEEVKLFEENFAKYCNAKYCIGVGNGLDALVLILKAYIQLGKLEKGDEVIVPSNTYIATILAVLEADLVPVLVEPRLETYNINPDLIEAEISDKTKAILPVHLYGQLAEMDAINAIAEKHSLLVIEDVAQAHGAFLNQKSKVESQKGLWISEKSSDVNCQLPITQKPTPENPKAYSFYPGKNLGALGDAGAITTNNDELAEVLFSLRNYGSKVKYENEFLGVNSRLDELQAAFLNLKLQKLDDENQVRRVIAKRYLTEIKNDKITLPFWDYSENHVFHLFVIRTKNRNQLKEYLFNKGIETMIHYPIPPHKQKALKDLNNLSFPIAEKIHDEVLSIPLNGTLTEAEINKIITTLNNY